jgi:ABC-2 type transport system permease protein
LSVLTGTGALGRSILRRDRLRILLWILGAVVLVWSSAAGIKGIYDTPQKLRSAAVAVEGNAAAIAFNGPAQGLETLGGRIAFEAGTAGLVVVALMSLFMVGRLTRAEEESGRLELIRATVVGRHTPMAAAVAVVSAMNITVAAATTLVVVAQDVPVAGSVVFGLGFLAVGLAFTAVAALTAQVSENTRVAHGLAGALVGLAFVLRAAGDIGDGTLSWLSPIGWVQKARPFAGEQWWPLILPVLLAAGCLTAAGALASRRDLGGGLFPPRPGPAVAGPGLSSPLGLALRLQHGGLLWWSIGVLSLGLVYGSVANDLEEFLADNDALRDVLARSGTNLVDSFFGTTLLILAIVGSGFGLQATQRLRSEETALRVEPLLAAPVSRRRWMASHLSVAFAGSAVVLAAGGLGIGFAYAIVTREPGHLPPLVADALAYLPAVSVLIAVAAALGGLLPRLATAPWALLAFSLVVGFFGEILRLPSWVTGLSPFEHTPLLPAERLTLAPLLILAALAVGFTVAGGYGFRRRDIG